MSTPTRSSSGRVCKPPTAFEAGQGATLDYSSKRAPRGGGTESDSSDNSDDSKRSNDNSDDPMRTPSRLPRAAQKVKARLPHEGDNRAQKRRNKSKKARREQAAGKHRKIILSDSDDGTDGTGEASDGDARAPTDFVASAANSENADNAEGAAATEDTFQDSGEFSTIRERRP